MSNQPTQRTTDQSWNNDPNNFHNPHGPNVGVDDFDNEDANTNYRSQSGQGFDDQPRTTATTRMDPRARMPPTSGRRTAGDPSDPTTWDATHPSGRGQMMQGRGQGQGQNQGQGNMYERDMSASEPNMNMGGPGRQSGRGDVVYTGVPSENWSTAATMGSAADDGDSFGTGGNQFRGAQAGYGSGGMAPDRRGDDWQQGPPGRAGKPSTGDKLLGKMENIADRVTGRHQ